MESTCQNGPNCELCALSRELEMRAADGSAVQCYRIDGSFLGSFPGHNVGHSFDEPEAVEPNDTERPPPQKPIDQRTCYFCGEPAVAVIYNDMPTCERCQRRAVGSRHRG